LVLPPDPFPPQHVVAERDRERIWALKFILNIFVDKKQAPIYLFMISFSYQQLPAGPKEQEKLL